MDLHGNVSLIYMMMDCPRCGFAQPKDRYCASCGLDVENYHAAPTPIWIRILQSPNFHLSLIAILIVFVVGYILYSRSELVTREVGQLLGGSPISSREAADPDDAGEDKKAPAAPAAAPKVEPPPAAVAVSPGTAPTESDAKALAAAVVDPQKVDVGFWEVSRETLVGQISGAEKVGETNEGRAYIFKDGSKIADAIRAGSRRLSLNRAAPLQAGSQVMVVTPPSTPEPFQFGLAVQVMKFENKEAVLRWDSQLVLSQPESAQEMASTQPSMKTVIEAALNGSATLNGSGVVVLVLEPANRHPRDEYLAKAGEGPWSIFSSEDFRNGLTDWVVLIQLK
jgi:hypothetical protein